jgi:hypothetical protein
VIKVDRQLLWWWEQDEQRPATPACEFAPGELQDAGYVGVPLAAGPAGLAQVLAWEDRQEDDGLLEPDNRRTCHTCRTWVTQAHLASAVHRGRTQPSLLVQRIGATS